MVAEGGRKKVVMINCTRVDLIQAFTSFSTGRKRSGNTWG